MTESLARFAAALGRRYAIEGELGRGGMATVYLAVDRKHGRRVAVKVLPPEVAAALGPERFLREIEIVARLSHPNILPLHDSGQAAGLLYYVTPYVEGESLRQRLGRTPVLPVSEALGIAREVADALACAHAHGVLHRDVKPDNILLHEGHALLADFGVARAAGEGTLTDSGLAVGTAAYASPEQAAGSRSVDARSDVYALGCVLYEMLATASQPPPRDMLERRFAEPLPPPGTLRRDVPSWLDRLVARAMAPRLDERFASAAELREALAGQPEHGVDLPGASARRAAGRAGWFAAGAATLTAIGAAVAFLPGRRSGIDARQVVVAEFENRTGDPALAPIGDIASDYVARGLAATHLLHDVYDARATALETGHPARAGVGPGRELAKRLGAGTVLGGSYYREGDSLHFEAQLVDAATGRLVLSLEPVVGRLEEKTRLVERLRQRVMAAFALVFQPAFEDWEVAAVPPTYDAYQELIAANDDLWIFHNDRAEHHFRRALAEDSTYTTAKVLLAFALATLSSCDGVDSLGRALRENAEPLPPADAAWLSYAEAECRHDREAKLTAARSVLAVAPHSVAFTVLAGINAIELSRPREALAILQRFDARHAPLGPAQRSVYWDFVGYAYHALSDFRRELLTARETAGLDPSLRLEEARALAALGDTAAAGRLAESWLARPDPGFRLYEGEMALCVALELRAHGHPAAATALVHRAAEAYRARGAAAMGEGPCLWNLFSAAYYDGRWADAAAGYARQEASDTDNPKLHAALAALAVHRGDREALEREHRWLAAHPGSTAALGLARVAALQGRRDEAVQLLRRALEGDVERHFLHLDPDLESLRDYPPYQELLRPRG